MNKKSIISIFEFLIILGAYILFGVHLGSTGWMQSPTDLQKEIYVSGIISSILFFTLMFVIKDLMKLVPWSKLRSYLSNKKDPT